MRNLVFILCSLFCISFLTAQDAEPILFSLEGNAKYLPANGGKAISLSPGDQLPLDGRIKLKSNTTLGIYYEYGYTYFDQKGKHDVEPLMQSSQLTEGDVIEVLGTQLIGSLHPYYASITATKDGFGSGTGPVRPPKEEEKDGHGDGSIQLIRVSPLGGKIAGSNITFSWKSKEGYQSINEFKLTIINQFDQVILDQMVSGTSITLDASSLELVENAQYLWQVTASDDEDIKSVQTAFTYVPASEMKSILDHAQAEDCWQKATPNARLLMDASVLEATDFVTAANAKFEQAYLSDKDNNLSASIYKAFLFRYGLLR